ncbi:MAG: DUF4440 domain-containing protein [Bacteroidota bacterium]
MKITSNTALIIVFFSWISLSAQDVPKGMNEFMDEFEHAEAKWDAASLGSMYAKNATYISMTGEVYKGQEDITGHYEQWFNETGMVPEIQRTEWTVFPGKHVMLEGKFTYYQPSENGEQIQEVNGMYWTIVKKEKGDWKIIRYVQMVPDL